MQATVVVSPTPAVVAPSGRHALTSGRYAPGVRPAPVVLTCVWCSEPITPEQKRQNIGLGILHNEPSKPCVAEFDAMAYGQTGRAR